MSATAVEDELPPLSALPAQEFPTVRRDAPLRAVAGRRRVSELRVLLVVVLSTLATGVSVGLALDGRPSLSAILTTGALTVLLVWTVLPLLLVRR